MITKTTAPPETSTATVTGVRAVTFTAQELEGLSRQVSGWLMEHPSAVPLAFSHAAETRAVVRTPPSLAGPEPRVFYTGILLVRG
jgi:hypothetical protein